jgi:hypothetical protein
MDLEEYFERQVLGEIKLSNVDHHVILTARNLLFFPLNFYLRSQLYQKISIAATQVDQLFVRLMEATPMAIRHCHLPIIQPLTA